MNSQKLRVGVLMGGRSIEREVSFNSGRTICDHLDTQRYTVIPIFQTADGTLYELPQHFLHRGKISDFSHRLPTEAKKLAWGQLKGIVDFMYLAQHGRYGEDGIIQGMLEVLNIPYLGTKVLGSAIGMDKARQKELLINAGVDVARGIVVEPSSLTSLTTEQLCTDLAARKISLPVIVKPSHEGSSLGIVVVEHADQLVGAVMHAATVDHKNHQAVLIEEKLVGMEFVCVLLEKIINHNNVITRSWFSLPLTEVILEENTTFFDYEQKYMPGKALKITPARCSAEIAERIVRACHATTEALGFTTMSRIDGFLSNDGRVVIIDPNTLTGMAPSTFLFAQAAEAGMSHTDLINLLIDNELQSYGLVQYESDSEKERDAMNAHPYKKLRVAVIFGGDSNEREVSFESGRNVCYKLSPHKYDVIPVFLSDQMELFHISQKILIKNSTRAVASLVTDEMRLEWSDLPQHADFVFLGLHGGKGENGSVQGALEMLDMPYNGSGVLASALCMNKFKTNTFLRARGFHVPRSALLEKSKWLELQAEAQELFINDFLSFNNLELPVIAKPHDDGCSVMVSKSKTIQALIANVDAYFASQKTTVLIEELVTGVELTIGVFGNDNPQAMPPSLAVAKGDILTQEEKFLPGAGENQTPAPLPASALALVQQTVRDAYLAVGCKGYARIDCFYEDAAISPTGIERVVLLEFNTLPALTPATCLFHQAAELGIKPMDFLDTIIELGLALHKPTAPVRHGAATQTSFTDDSLPVPPQVECIAEPVEIITEAVTTDPEVALDEAVFKPILEEELKPEPMSEEAPIPKKAPKVDDATTMQASDETFTMSLF